MIGQVLALALTHYHLVEGINLNFTSLSVVYVDLLVSESLASSLGRPALAGQWIGTLEVDLDATTPDALDRHEAPAPIDKPSSSAPLDLRLGELYGLMSNGRSGTYPNGMNGLSAATTSCNTGSVPIPWNAPMAETHPFIGLSMFRVRNGVLEQIGINWIKHGFFALSSNQCVAHQVQAHCEHARSRHRP